jgi:hypothetical protein
MARHGTAGHGKAGHGTARGATKRSRSDLSQLSELEIKVLENRLRRIAARRGYRLVKSRLRDVRAIGYGGYMVIEVWNNTVALGATPYAFSASLEDVAEFFEGDE